MKVNGAGVGVGVSTGTGEGVASGAVPLIGLFLMPVALVALYLSYRRFGIYLPVFALAAYGIASLTLNYDIITVVYLCFLIIAFFALVTAVQLKIYLLRAAVVLVFCALGCAAGCGVASLVENAPVPDICASYITTHADESFFDGLIERVYDNADIDEEERVGKDSPEYKAAATEYAAQYIRDETDGYIAYYCIHFGALFGLVAFFGATVINGMTASPYDESVTEKQINRSSRALGGAYRDGVKMRDMRLPRLYLLIFVLPALIASIVLGIAGGLEAQSATVMHACITMPSEFAFVTLATYIATLFNGKGRVIALVVLSLLLLANILSIVLLVCSIFGLCDCILNLRYWIKYLAGD